MQSSEELIKAGNAMGLSSDVVKLDVERLQRIFNIRNQIVHDLDIELDASRRNRYIRKKSDMISHTNYILEIAESILYAVDEKLS